MEYFLPYQETKDVTVTNDCSPPKWAGEPWGNSGLKRIPAIQQPSDCSHSLRWALRKLGMWKHRILAPESWGAYQRNDFSEPRLLHLPRQRKALNSLPWEIWFSLFNNNFLMFPITCPSLQNSYISWLLPSPPWSSFSEPSETLSPGLQPSFCPK